MKASLLLLLGLVCLIAATQAESAMVANDEADFDDDNDDNLMETPEQQVEDEDPITASMQAELEEGASTKLTAEERNALDMCLGQGKCVHRRKIILKVVRKLQKGASAQVYQYLEEIKREMLGLGKKSSSSSSSKKVVVIGSRKPATKSNVFRMDGKSFKRLLRDINNKHRKMMRSVRMDDQKIVSQTPPSKKICKKQPKIVVSRCKNLRVCNKRLGRCHRVKRCRLTSNRNATESKLLTLKQALSRIRSEAARRKYRRKARKGKDDDDDDEDDDSLKRLRSRIMRHDRSLFLIGRVIQHVKSKGRNGLIDVRTPRLSRKRSLSHKYSQKFRRMRRELLNSLTRRARSVRRRRSTKKSSRKARKAHKNSRRFRRKRRMLMESLGPRNSGNIRSSIRRSVRLVRKKEVRGDGLGSMKRRIAKTAAMLRALRRRALQFAGVDQARRE